MMNLKNKKIYEKIINWVDKYYRIIFFAILALAIFLNTYRLGDVPNGVHIDEAGMTYDAWCIANYGGVDRYLKHLPVYFINFRRRTKCPLYIFNCNCYKNFRIL